MSHLSFNTAAQLLPLLSLCNYRRGESAFFIPCQKGHHARGKSLDFTDSLHYLSNASFSLQLHSFECSFLSEIYVSDQYRSCTYICNIYVHLSTEETLTLDEFCCAAVCCDLHELPTKAAGMRNWAHHCGPSLYVNDWNLRATSRLYLISVPQQLAADGASL